MEKKKPEKARLTGKVSPKPIKGQDEKDREDRKKANDLTFGMLRKGWILPDHVTEFSADILSVIRGE